MLTLCPRAPVWQLTCTLPPGVDWSLPQLSAWPFLFGGMRLEITTVLPAPPFLSTGSARPAVGNGERGRGAELISGTCRCHPRLLPGPPQQLGEAGVSCSHHSYSLPGHKIAFRLKPVLVLLPRLRGNSEGWKDSPPH